MADTVGDAMSMVQNALILYELHEDSKNALREMRTYIESIDDNEYLLGAMDRAIYYMSIDPQISEKYIVGRYSCDFVVEQGWDIIYDQIKKDNPAVAAFMFSYKTTKWVVNTGINTEKIVASEIECVLVYELTEAFDAACMHQMNVYAAERTEENAKLLIAITKMMFRAHLVNCDKSITLCHSLDYDEGDWFTSGGKTVVNKLIHTVFPNQSNAQVIEQIQSIKNIHNSNMQYALVAWVEDLQETHPGTGLYEYYKKELDDAENRIKNHIYAFACPVEVNIESSLGTSFVSSDKIHAEDDVVIVLEGDQKTIYTITNSDYAITLNGTGDGTMRSQISEYNADGNAVVARSYFDIPLSVGEQYEVKATLIDNADDTNRILYRSGEETEDYNSELRIKHNVTIEYGYIIADGNMYYGDVELAENQEVTIVAYVPFGAEFSEWQINGEAQAGDTESATTTLKVGSEDLEISALFEEAVTTYTISASAGEGGVIAMDGDIHLNAGGNQEFMIIPDDGYAIEDVMVDGVSVGKVSSYSFENVTEDHVIMATFGESTFILGDVNNDSKVNAADRIYLARYLAGWSGYSLTNERAADVNQDNKVNAADRIYLARYLAGWSGYSL